MNDKVLDGVPRELLERIVDPHRRVPQAIHLHNADCLELRALLSEQPQASTLSCVCGEPELPGIHRNDAPCYANLPQASAAQSAPAGEREAFRAAHRELDLSEKPDAWGRPQFLHSHVEVTWRGFQAGTAWQRAQSAPVAPEGKALIDVAVVEFLNGSGELHGTHFGDHIPGQPQFWWRRYLPAAPAQPAAQGEFGDAYQGAREDLAIWKRRALEAEAKVRNAEQSTPAAIEVIGYASPGQVEILRSLPRTGGMKVKGCKDGRYTEPVVLLSAARAALFTAVIRCEQAGAFKTCMECGYQDGHDEICKFHDSNRAADDQGEVQRLREALRRLLSEIDRVVIDEQTYRDALINARSTLAASTGQEVKP